jgi:hypothetical protein
MVGCVRYIRCRQLRTGTESVKHRDNTVKHKDVGNVITKSVALCFMNFSAGEA